MSPPTLLTMAQRACIRDIAGLIDIGDMTYDLVRPILKKVNDPEQLRKIELASPHIADHDAELWKAFIARDIPLWREKMIEPKDPRSWGKVYRKMVREESTAREEQEQQLAAAMKGIAKTKQENKLNVVNRVLSYPGKAELGRGQHFVEQIPEAPRPRLKNAKTGADIMHAIRRQSVLASKEKGMVGTMSVNKSLRYGLQPTRSVLKEPKSQITKAPESMLLVHQRPQLVAAARQVGSQREGSQGEREPKTQSTTTRIFASRGGPSRVDKEISEARRADQKHREDRLRAIAAGKPALPLSPPSSQPRSITSAQQVSVAPRAATSHSAAPQPTAAQLSAPRGLKRSADALSPPKPMSPAPSAGHATLRVTEDAGQTASPSPAPLVRKRPAVSIFMPKKKVKV